MNINAGTNSYNIKLTKLKEEKRPTFATIFDKLDARSKKLNNKNPLNAVMTNEQMFRYYLEEVEPLIQGSDSGNLDTLDEILGNKNIKDMKLSEFAKLLMGNVNDDKGVKYETLAASVSSNGVMSIAPIATPPTPTPTPPLVPMSSGSVSGAPVMGSLGGSGATGVGLSGLPAAPSAPVVASSAPAVAPSAPVVASSAPVAPAPVAPASAALTISTAPTGIATPPTSVFASLSSAVSSGVSAVSSLVKPSPSAISVPPSAVASGATTAGAAGAAGGAAGAAAGITPPVSPTAGGGYVDKQLQDVYAENVALGYKPPIFDSTLPSFSSKNIRWITQLDKMNEYNKSVVKPELMFPFTDKQKRVIKALEVNSTEKNPIKFVYDNIKKDSKYLNNPMFKP